MRQAHSAPGDEVAHGPRDAQAAARSESRRRRRSDELRRGRAAQVRPGQQPVKQQTGARRAEHPRGQFVRESYAELKKVDWPSRSQTFQGVVVVIIACVIVGAYLWGLDQIIRPLVDRVLL